MNTNLTKTIYIGWNIDSISIETFTEKIKKDDLLINLTNRPEVKIKNKKGFEIININKDSTENAVKEITEHLDIIRFDRWEPLNIESIDNDESNEARIIFRMISEIANAMIMQRNTLLTRTLIFVQNFFKNIGFITNQLSLQNLHNQFQNRPFIIVAAGPSLDKQLETLKKYQHYFYIIAVDKAYPSLKKYNIIPDFVITIDPVSIPSWQTDQLSEKTIFINDIGSSNDMVKSNNKNRLFISSSQELTEIGKYFGIESDFLESGGSVATSAFSLAYICGANPIVFLGQDLAFTDNKDHAEDYINAYSSELIENKIKTGFTTQGYYGDQVQTDNQLLMYKYWFEKKFNMIKDRYIFNCTEGGANIIGAINIPFKTICTEISSSMPEKQEILNNFFEPKENQDLINEVDRRINDLKILLIDILAEFKNCLESIENKKNISPKLELKINKAYDLMRNIDNPIKLLLANFNRRGFYTVNHSIARSTKKTKAGLLNHHINFIESTIDSLESTIDFLENLKK